MKLNLKDEEMIIAEIKNNHMYHLQLEPEQLTERVLSQTLMISPKEYPRFKVTTPDIDLLAVRLDGFNLEFVENKTYEICMTAIEEDANTIKFVPEEFQDEALVTKLIRQYADNYYLTKFKNANTDKLAVIFKHENISFVSKMTNELAMCAVSGTYTPNALLRIPREFQTKEVILEAIKFSPANVYNIKKSIDSDLIIEMAKANANVLLLLPKPKLYPIINDLIMVVINNPSILHKLSEIKLEMAEDE